MTPTKPKPTVDEAIDVVENLCRWYGMLETDRLTPIQKRVLIRACAAFDASVRPTLQHHLGETS